MDGFRDEVDREAEARQPWWRRFPVWFPLGVYLVSRLYVFVMVEIQQRSQIALPLSKRIIRVMYPMPESPGYFNTMMNWDGQWYRMIAEKGYPAILPRVEATGAVDMNPWAFYPVFPFTTRAGMKLTGLPFVVVGAVLSTLVGALAVYLLFRLVDQAVGRWEAIVAVVAVCFYIASAIMSASYTESWALLMVVICLLLLRARRYWWLALALVVLAFTRNIVAAMAPAIVAHAVVNYRNKDEGEHPVRRRAGMLGLLALIGVLTAIWGKIIAHMTGNPNGYAETMASWKFSTDLKVGQWWTFMYRHYGIGGQVAAVLIVIAFSWWMLSKHSWRWGPEIWGWMGAYTAYMVLVINPSPSRIRYAILAFPFALVLAWVMRSKFLERWRWHLLALVVLAGAVQMWWYTDRFFIIHSFNAKPLLFP